jgi:predicted RNA-binding protein YlqC (UPF0109 family)
MDAKTLVEYIVKALVDKPEGVSLKTVNGEKTTIIELKVSSEDIGKVIGKQGRIARAIRTILAAVASKEGKRINLEILD